MDKYEIETKRTYGAKVNTYVIKNRQTGNTIADCFANGGNALDIRNSLNMYEELLKYGLLEEIKETINRAKDAAEEQQNQALQATLQSLSR